MGASPNPTDAQLIARAVDELARRTSFPIAFGGLAYDDEIHVASVVGARTHRIDGLVVRSARGLGGRALVEKRPRLALDYRSARGITHDYDAAILGEGISTLFAVPVIVDDRARGVLYCGSWSESQVAEVTAQPAFRIAESLAAELRVRDEVERRMSRLPLSADGIAPAAREELRESYAELRSIAAAIDDAGLRARLAAVEQRLAALSHASGGPRADLGDDVRLSPRETDVLACAALGSTNAEIAAALRLKEGTVKSYLQSAMSKLDSSTRHAAVTKARRIGILP